MQGNLYPQQEVLRARLPWVIGGLILASMLLLFSLARFQWLSPEVQQEFELRGQAGATSIRRLPAERGIIYDRDGEPMAVNTLQYGIGISPNLVSNPRRTANELGVILNRDELDLYQLITSPVPWALVARPVTAEVGQQIADLNIFGLTIEPIPRRFYPQGVLASQVIGFVIEDRNTTRGVLGVEGYYNNQLAGRGVDQQVSNLPFALPSGETVDLRGNDVVLTIDRDIQFWIERQLLLAINETGSTGGTIIVMDPRNGDILGMASYPTFDPNNFVNIDDPLLLRNPAITEVFEPGSVMKVLTVAGALESGTITPDWTYNDQGVFEIGGIRIENWDRRAHGAVDVTQVLVQSLNVGAATISYQMGPDAFYAMMRNFGIGQPTRIDLPGEEAGILKTRTDPNWSESDLGTNAFGQGVSVTPLQMITAFSAIANGGLMMQPRIVNQIIDGSQVINAHPTPLMRSVSPETARLLTGMMVRVVEEGVPTAMLPGYTVAGKTSTAQIASPIGYEPGASIVMFIGFLPVDDPQVIVMVKLDRPNEYWGSLVAAPVFRRVMERLVILLEIPPDDVRRTLAAGTGSGPQP